VEEERFLLRGDRREKRKLLEKKDAQNLTLRERLAQCRNATKICSLENEVLSGQIYQLHECARKQFVEVSIIILRRMA